MYKIELHLHTKYASVCGRLGAHELLARYAAAGYSGLVVTDHFNRETFEDIPAIAARPPHERADAFWEGYRRMRDAAPAYGLQIYRGAELRFDGSENDFLLFGFDEALLADYDAILRMTPAEFSAYRRGSGALFIQAHPYRDGSTPVDPRILDGVEVCNTHPQQNNRNRSAFAFARANPQLLRIGGSDCHDAPHAARGGILSPTLPSSDKTLPTLLTSRSYTVIQP